VRTWVFQRMVNDAGPGGVAEMVTNPGDPQAEPRIYEDKYLNNSPALKPFIVYAMGNDTAEPGMGSAHRQFLIIYVHDEIEGGDYLQIDEVLKRLKKLFDDADGDPAHGVMTCHYLETSRDLEDDQMQTVVRYIRFQLVGT
jgi:hypothetical protein